MEAVHFRPPNDVEEVLQAAQFVAEQQGLSKGWLSIDAGLYFNAIPDDWKSRRVDIGRFGRLHVYAIGRLDLIAMKFFAHRQADIEHLALMGITPAELTFAADHLKRLFDKLLDDKSKIEMGIYAVENWGKAS